MPGGKAYSYGATAMPGRSLRIARIAGIPVGVSPWWLAIVALITWSLGASYFPEGVQASELMSAPAISIPEHTPIAHAARAYFRPYRYTAFPVVDELGRAVGMVSIAQVEALARQRRASQELAGVVDRDPSLIVHADEDVAGLLERPAFARVGRAVVVDEPGKPLGLISITDVQRALRASRLAENANGHAAAG